MTNGKALPPHSKFAMSSLQEKKLNTLIMQTMPVQDSENLSYIPYEKSVVRFVHLDCILDSTVHISLMPVSTISV